MARRDGEPCFVNSPPDRYLCSWSPHILRNGFRAECGHQFCRGCIEFGGDDSWVCPVCNKKVYKKSLTSISDKQGILSLIVYCAYEKNGCTWTGPWRKHKYHLSTCPYREMVTCQLCRQEIPKCKQEQHRREFCYRPCQYCGKTVRSSLLKVHQFASCPQTNVAGFAQPLEKPTLGCACECRNPCCSLYTMCHGAFCRHGVTTIPVCVSGKGKENLREQAEEAKLEKATKEILDIFDDILALTKERLSMSEYRTNAKIYMSQQCPGGGDFFKECVWWYSIFKLKELVLHIALSNPEPVLKKMDDFERRVDEFIVSRIIQCDNQVICMKVDSLFSHIPAKVCNVDLLVNRVKQAVLKYTGKEIKVWFCNAHQAVNLELHDAVQCSVDVTGAVDQNNIYSSDFASQTNQHETNQSCGPLPFLAPFGKDC